MFSFMLLPQPETFTCTLERLSVAEIIPRQGFVANKIGRECPRKTNTKEV